MTSDVKVRLFPGGPEFPAEFLDAVQKGEAVFFCGAGLSVGTGLPTFSGLVRKLDGILNHDPAHRFDYDKRKDYDRMLDELAEQFTGGRKQMCEHVREILSAPPPNAASLENHRSILKLAAVPDRGFRLVTTNFDDRFALANGGAIQSKDWPELPSPRSEQWASLVHLHGRIRNNDRLDDLILTASDFGAAYVPPDPRAANFVIDLLRRWPVAFVGYGLDDPPMRYLMDAVYDPRGNPEEFHQAFALVGYKKGKENDQRREWEGKRVVPILYDGADGHAALRPVLRELARLKDEPGYRAELAVRGTDGNPDDEGGDNGRRVVWALKNPAVAQSFAKEKFFSNTKDGEKFVRWLNAFKKTKKVKLFRADNAAPIDTLDYPPRFPPLPSIAKHLIDWVARHAHQPALLRWLAGQDASLHPALVRELHSRVFGGDKAGPAIPEELRELWGVFLQSHPVDSAGMELLDRQAYRAEALPPNAKLELSRRVLSALRPLPIVVPRGQSARVRWDAKNFGIRVDVGCELMRFPGQGDFILKKLKEEKNAGFALAHAEELSAYLEQALSIMAWREMPAGGLACLLSETDQHGNYRENYWKFLARMVQNSVRELIRGKKHRRLANLISRWAESEHPLLWRMALYAAAEAAKHFSKFRDGGNWGAKILAKQCEALWGHECRPECLRFLRRAGGTIDSRELSKLERVILDGPPEEFRSDSFDGPPRKAAAVRLAKLKLSEANLSSPSEKFLAAAQSDFPDADFGGRVECRSRFRMGGVDAVPQEDKLTRITPDMSPEQCADMIQKFRAEDGGWSASSFVERSPEQAVATYEALAARGAWDGVNWGDFLATLANRREIDDARATRLLRMLDSAPNGFLADSFNVALALENIAEFRPFSDMEKIWREMWRAGAERDIQKRREDGTVRDAFMDPCGMLAEVAIVRLSREKDFGRFVGLLEEILESRASGHFYGRAVVAGYAGFLFHMNREWTEKRVIPMFAEGHPDSLHIWVEFLKHLEMSADLAEALKPALIDAAKRADKFSDHYARSAFAELAFYVCDRFPAVFSAGEQRRLVGNMGEDTLGDLCVRLKSKLWDSDFAARGEIWRKSIGPFLKRAWPKHSSAKTSKNSELLGNIVTRTGDAFPDAVDWAEDFLSPIAFPLASTSGFIIHELCKENEEGEIPGKFPEACLRFLHCIVNPEDGPQYEFLGLSSVLDEIGKARPELCKRKKFRELREALAK